MMPSIMISDLFDNPSYIGGKTMNLQAKLTSNETNCFMSLLLEFGQVLYATIEERRKVLIRFVPSINLVELLADPEFNLSLWLFMAQIATSTTLTGIFGKEEDWKSVFRKELEMFPEWLAAVIYGHAMKHYGNSIDNPEEGKIPSHAVIDSLREKQRALAAKINDLIQAEEPLRIDTAYFLRKPRLLVKAVLF